MSLQANPNFLQLSYDFVCLNALKSAQNWAFVDNSGVPAPTSLDANGYPTVITNGGVYTVFFVAPQSDRPGNFIIRWSGGGTIDFLNSFSVVGGSLTNLSVGVWNNLPGYCMISTSDTRIVFRITAIDTAARITSAQFAHQYDDPLITAGLNFSPYFAQLLNGSGLAQVQALGLASAQFSSTQTWTQALSAIQPWGVSVLRDLDICSKNSSNVAKWVDRQPVNHFSWAAGEERASIFAGTTGGTTSAFTATLSGFTLTQGTSITVKFNVTGSVDGSGLLTCTLNVNGLGAKPIRIANGEAQAFGTLLPLAGAYGTLTYDADLGVFLLTGGSLAGGNAFLGNGMPCERFIELCAFCGVDPWIVQPYLSSVPAQDYMGSYAQYIKTNYPSMHPSFELVSNENWNYAQPFIGTRYGWQKAFARWGTSNDSNNYHGLGISLNAPAILAVYTKAQCEIICGVQTTSVASSSNARMESTLYVAEAPAMNKPASYYVTRGCMANYWHPVIADPLIISLAWQYSLTPTAAILNQMLPSDGSQIMLNYASAWLAWFAGYGAKLSCYEGGYDAGTWQSNDLTSNLTGPITGITAAASAVITFSGTYQPAVGSTVTISGVDGMTQINGLTGTVTASTATTATVNINSSAFSAYVAAGTITGSITGITKAASAVISFSGTLPTVGSIVTISGVVGMTEINGKTGTVSASGGGTITVNIDSTAFTTYASGGGLSVGGGTMTLTSSMTYINALYAAVWASTRLSDQELNATQRLIAMGVKEPSIFDISGDVSTWAKTKPNIYHAGGSATAYNRLLNNAPLQMTVKLV